VAAKDAIEPSGSPDFDRARTLFASGRIAEALDWFEVASTTAADPLVRASACAFVAGILLSEGRPWEVPSWSHMVRVNGGDGALASMLEASARLQLGEVDEARALLADADAPHDPWYPCSPASVRVVWAHVRHLDGDREGAANDVLVAFTDDPFAADVWDAFARFCAETDFDPTPAVDQVPHERTVDILRALRASSPTGVARIAELIWARDPADARVLALVPSFAARIHSIAALQWSARMRAAGMGRTCPLLARADDLHVEAGDRVRAAALAYASFGDKRGRQSLERVVPVLTEEELDAALDEVWSIAPALADSVVVAGATTSRRALRIAAALFEGGATNEAYTVLVHGLSVADAERLTTDEVVELLPVPVLEGLAAAAELRGELDVAGILEAVAVVASEE
jgi:hypothetical protein